MESALSKDGKSGAEVASAFGLQVALSTSCCSAAALLSAAREPFLIGATPCWQSCQRFFKSHDALKVLDTRSPDEKPWLNVTPEIADDAGPRSDAASVSCSCSNPDAYCIAICEDESLK